MLHRGNRFSLGVAPFVVRPAHMMRFLPLQGFLDYPPTQPADDIGLLRDAQVPGPGFSWRHRPPGTSARAVTRRTVRQVQPAVKGAHPPSRIVPRRHGTVREPTPMRA
jgi:hypothetical protein